jgi:FixJ family two-component response regulator
MSSRTSQIPVVVLSGSMDPAAADTLVRKLGAVEFIAKPVDPEAVHQAIVRSLIRSPVIATDDQVRSRPFAVSK